LYGRRLPSGTALAMERREWRGLMNTARKLCSFLLIATAFGLLAVSARS
jgi:hypothetical protein